MVLHGLLPDSNLWVSPVLSGHWTFHQVSGTVMIFMMQTFITHSFLSQSFYLIQALLSLHNLFTRMQMTVSWDMIQGCVVYKKFSFFLGFTFLLHPGPFLANAGFPAGCPWVSEEWVTDWVYTWRVL